jgi:transposase InsO family protein
VDVLYVILDVFSRYFTGWMVAMRESAELAKRQTAKSCQKQRIHLVSSRCMPTVTPR